MNEEKEVTKEEFKSLYFKYSTQNSGLDKDYWNKFFEKDKDKKYFFREPESPKHNRMFIITDKETRRMVFLTEEGEESFFDFPDTE